MELLRIKCYKTECSSFFLKNFVYNWTLREKLYELYTTEKVGYWWNKFEFLKIIKFNKIEQSNNFKTLIEVTKNSLFTTWLKL